MELNRFKNSFSKMSHDQFKPLKIPLSNTKSIIIITSSADLDSASDFIADFFESDDLNQIRSILVQASIEEKFIELLRAKLRYVNKNALISTTIQEMEEQIEKLKQKGFPIIKNNDIDETGSKATVIKCPRSLITSNNLPLITLEVFRTTKEAISFAKGSLSVGIWCENISIAYEFINSLNEAFQIWFNSSHGKIHPKIPFYNGEVICEDPDIRNKSMSASAGSIVEIFDNVQFITKFRSSSFQTVVIPFGESFAN
ncbi:CLUMA_CG012494, isoform A [Clunio marinus]|uniref:CLUMA_CG012494, isoform A n=1 Tax=Clunio marinus TaxID=568069 RepID=A0A1J1IHF0_9DIPT|nr:CLUMA_CG012494, isoform A [Clunio marinus]